MEEMKTVKMGRPKVEDAERMTPYTIRLPRKMIDGLRARGNDFNVSKRVRDFLSACGF